jgi:predicted lipoprotein with Yx(FWY)xxD motif
MTPERPAMNLRFLSAALLALSAPLAYAEPPAKMTGGMLVNTSGMTLYSFDRDVAGSGKSVCNGPCATLWPPAMAAADAKAEGDFTIVTRDDGGKQWAYKGKPVYLYSVDKKAGEVTGDNFRDVWHVIK